MWASQFSFCRNKYHFLLFSEIGFNLYEVRKWKQVLNTLQEWWSHRWLSKNNFYNTETLMQYFKAAVVLEYLKNKL